MNREIFDSMNIEEQMNWVNHELGKNNTLTHIAKTLNISRRTFARRFEKINYKYSDDVKQYIKIDDDIVVTPVTQVTPVTPVTPVTQEEQTISNTSNTSNTGVTIPKNTINEIMEMLEWYKEQKNIQEGKTCLWQRTTRGY